MKIGFCMLLWTTSLDASHRRLLEDIRATGYDGVEIPMFGGTPDDYARRRADARRDRARADGDQRHAAGGRRAVGGPGRCAGPRSERLAWAADCAAALGATCVGGPLHQVLGQFSGAGPTEAEFERMREVHRAAGDDAAGRASPSRWRRSTGSRATSPTPWTISAPTSPRSATRRSRRCTTPSTPTSRRPTRWPPSRATPTAMTHVHISENDRGVPGRGHVPWADDLPGDQGVGLRRLADHRGIRPQPARPRRRDADLARPLREPGGGLSRRLSAHPQRLGRGLSIREAQEGNPRAARRS